MTAAERRAKLLDSATTPTDLLLVELIRTLDAMRADFARREERRLQGTGAIPTRKANAPAGSSGATYRFGRLKGQPLVGSSERDLEWYANAVSQSIDDPAKERYRDENERHLAEIQAAMGNGAPAPRKTETVGGVDFGPPRTDDDLIPF